MAIQICAAMNFFEQSGFIHKNLVSEYVRSWCHIKVHLLVSTGSFFEYLMSTF